MGNLDNSFFFNLELGNNIWSGTRTLLHCILNKRYTLYHGGSLGYVALTNTAVT
jgi:hypothetical protein